MHSVDLNCVDCISFYFICLDYTILDFIWFEVSQVDKFDLDLILVEFWWVKFSYDEIYVLCEILFYSNLY